MQRSGFGGLGFGGAGRRAVVPGHLAGLDVVHRADDHDLALLLHLAKDGALVADGLHRQVDIVLGHHLDKGRVFGAALQYVGGHFGHSGFDLAKQTRQVAEFHAVAGALDRAAAGVAHHHQQLRTSHLVGKFKTAEDVFVDDVARHPGIEKVANALVQNDLGRGARVDARDHAGQRVLAGRRGPNFLEVLLLQRPAGDKAGIAGFETLQHLLRTHLALAWLGVLDGAEAAGLA